jgi:hypothetical protein
LEERDRVAGLGKEVVEPEADAEGNPPLPMVVGCFGMARYDGGSDRVLNSKEISVESNGGHSGQKRQDFVWG